MDYKLPCSLVHGIFQARVLEWVAISFSRGSSQPRDWAQVSCIVGLLHLPSELPTPVLWPGEFQGLYSLSSVHYGRSVVSDSLRPHELPHAGPPCPSPAPGVYSDSCPLSQWCHPTISSSVVLFSSCLQPSIFPNVGVFSNESAVRIRWPKYWSFRFSINPSNEYLGLISFRMDWLDFLAVQGTLKGLLQHHSSKASILQHSAFFIVQLSHICTWLLEKSEL